MLPYCGEKILKRSVSSAAVDIGLGFKLDFQEVFKSGARLTRSCKRAGFKQQFLGLFGSFVGWSFSSKRHLRQCLCYSQPYCSYSSKNCPRWVLISFERDEIPMMTSSCGETMLTVLGVFQATVLYAASTMLPYSEAAGVSAAGRLATILFLSRTIHALKPASPVRRQVSW